MEKGKQLIKDMFAEATESMKSQILSAILNEDAASNVLRYNSLLPIRDSVEINYTIFRLLGRNYKVICQLQSK